MSEWYEIHRWTDNGWVCYAHYEDRKVALAEMHRIAAAHKRVGFYRTLRVVRVEVITEMQVGA